MKRKIIISIALALSVILLSLTSSDSMVEAEPPQRFSYDTGLIIPGPHQKLRLTVNAGAGNDTINVRFKRMENMQAICNDDGVCKHTVSSQTTSAPIMLMPGEAAIQDILDGTSNTIVRVRGVVVSNSRNVRAMASIINALIGETVTQIILANTEGDF